MKHDERVELTTRTWHHGAVWFRILKLNSMTDHDQRRNNNQAIIWHGNIDGCEKYETETKPKSSAVKPLSPRRECFAAKISCACPYPSTDKEPELASYLRVSRSHHPTFLKTGWWSKVKAGQSINWSNVWTTGSSKALAKSRKGNFIDLWAHLGFLQEYTKFYQVLFC